EPNAIPSAKSRIVLALVTDHRRSAASPSTMDSGSTVKLRMLASEPLSPPSSVSPQAAPKSTRSASAIQPPRTAADTCAITPPNDVPSTEQLDTRNLSTSTGPPRRFHQNPEA